jgi:hypothetical protein
MSAGVEARVGGAIWMKVGVRELAVAAGTRKVSALWECRKGVASTEQGKRLSGKLGPATTNLEPSNLQQGLSAPRALRWSKLEEIKLDEQRCKTDGGTHPTRREKRIFRILKKVILFGGDPFQQALQVSSVPAPTSGLARRCREVW